MKKFNKTAWVGLAITLSGVSSVQAHLCVRSENPRHQNSFIDLEASPLRWDESRTGETPGGLRLVSNHQKIIGLEFPNVEVVQLDPNASAGRFKVEGISYRWKRGC